MKVLDIALICPTLSGGIGRVTLTLAEEMHNRGISVEIWTIGTHDQIAHENGVQVRTIRGGRVGFALFKLISMFREHRPLNILSASFHLNCVVILAKLMSQVKSKLVIVEHTSLTNGLKTLHWLKRAIAGVSIAVLYRFANRLVAVSNDAARQMEHYARLPKNYVKTIYNPVISSKLYTAGEHELSHPFSAIDEKIFLSVGRLSQEKDIPTLLKAFAETVKIRPCRLLIAGDGPEMPRISKLIIDLGLTQYVALLGHVKNPYPLYRQADVFVLSSTREGLPTVLIEALALGCIVVSTDARSGPREILEDGKLGLLVPPSNAVSLAAAMIQSLEHANCPEVTSNAELLKYNVDYAVDQYIRSLTI